MHVTGLQCLIALSKPKSRTDMGLVGTLYWWSGCAVMAVRYEGRVNDSITYQNACHRDGAQNQVLKSIVHDQIKRGKV